MVSVDTDSEGCKHLGNETVAWELIRPFRHTAFKEETGALEGGDLY
jgi:hypothetical protein